MISVYILYMHKINCFQISRVCCGVVRSSVLIHTLYTEDFLVVVLYEQGFEMKLYCLCLILTLRKTKDKFRQPKAC